MAEDWWTSFYDEHFAELVLRDLHAEAQEAELRFLRERLRLGPGAVVLDQGCGIGRLSLPLARAGVRVIGVDITAPYIDQARAQAQGLPCSFHVGDAGRFVPEEPCAAAFNWATSFGHAAEDARNGELLRRAFDALVPGGRMALDYPNVPRVLREFQPCLLQRHRGPGGETLILRESELDLAQGLLQQRWTYVSPQGQRRERQGSTRLYLPDQLCALFRGAGFVDLELYGGVAGEALSLASPRCVVLGRRPGG